ncbi:MAG: NAD-dependent DNA ligase LigA [Clostridia bacterium]|nr:NAD-dependent DNA ligase LigA [Clostridia bacterium]
MDLFATEKNETEEVVEEMKRLIKQINYYNKKYYEEDITEISDYAYDKLTVRLRELEALHPELKQKDSPTSKVGGKTKKIFSEVVHDVQMQSLQDVFSFGDVEAFVDKVCEEFGKDTEFVVETKIDGLSVSLEYENGVLVRGSTRGDGFVGEDVTQNIMMIKDIPHRLKSNDTVEIRGEVYLPRKEFENINNILLEKGKQQLANPRNAAAGTLRQLNSELVKSRNLSIFVFTILKGLNFETDTESLEYLKSIGVKTIEYMKKCVGKEQVLNAIRDIGALRDDLEYDIDGAVINVNNLSYRLEMGKTAKVPKWSVAYKYPPERKETKILDIVTQVGRTGQVTPMAILEPVRVAGSVISKTTLHNFDYIEEKDIRIGDMAVIEKAGDVIPEVVNVVVEKRTGNEEKYVVPTVCPICGEPLEKEEDIVALRCTNSECPALTYRSIIHFASRDCMDISGLGENIVEQLIDNALLKDVADIYYLKYEDIVNLERFAPKSAANLIEAINATKSNSLDKLIFGLGIRHVGKKASKILAENFGDIYKIMEADFETLNSLDDFGEIMANSVIEFFQKPETANIIAKLEEAGVNLKGSISQKVSEKLKDKTFVITGSFEGYTRNEIAEMIEKHCGKVSTSVSKKTSFLIAGEEAGSKLTKAQTLGINIIGLEELKNMIE